MIKRNLIAATKPDILIEADGDNYTVSTITSVKTIKISFTLGKEYEADPGTDKVSTVNTFFSSNLCGVSRRGRMLSQMPRSFTTRFQFVPTCEQTFWGYS